MSNQRLASGTPQRPIRLERKVLTREVVRFPGQAHLRGEPCAVKEAEWVEKVEEQEQTRSCVWDQDEADVPTPGAGSTPIATPTASTPAPRPSESTKGYATDVCSLSSGQNLTSTHKHGPHPWWYNHYVVWR